MLALFSKNVMIIFLLLPSFFSFFIPFSLRFTHSFPLLTSPIPILLLTYTHFHYVRSHPLSLSPYFSPHSFSPHSFSPHSVISLAIVCATIIETYLNDKGYNFVQVIVVSKLWSVGIWFLWATPFFAIRYGRDKRNFNANIGTAPCSPISPNSNA